MDKRYRIVFQGNIRAGFDPAVVRQQISIRLKASPEQITRIFSGAQVVLKKDLDAIQADSYSRALEQIGMIVSVVAMLPAQTAPAVTATPVSPATIKPAPAPAARVSARPAPPPPARSPTPAASHFERTHINLARAEALLNAAMPTQLAAPDATRTTLAPEGEKWMQETGFDRLERTQQKIASIEAQLKSTPALPPAQAARASLPQAAPEPARPASRPHAFTQRFVCHQCGAEHALEGSLNLEITLVRRDSREAG